MATLYQPIHGAVMLECLVLFGKRTVIHTEMQMKKKSVNTSEFSQYICEMGRGSDIYFSMVVAMIKLVNTCDVCVSVSDN